MADGFIKITRETGEQLITTDPNAYLILSLCTFRAAWKDNPVTGMMTGQAVMGFTDFPYLTRQQYREATKRIARYGFATIKTTNKGTLVSLNEHGFAQFGDGRTTIKTPIEQPSNNHQTTTNEEGKKLRKKEKSIPPPLAEVVSYFESKRKSVAMANNFFDYYESNGWRVGKNLMKKWKNAASGWIARQQEPTNQGGSHSKKSDAELLRLCTAKGIRTHGLLREELIAKLGVPA